MRQREYSWVTVDNLNIHAKEWKPEKNPVAVVALVHGLGEHTNRYQYVAERMTNAGFAVTGFDLRGHGKSEGIRGYAPSFDVLMQDINTHLKNTRESFPGIPVFLYGHSLGANLVLYYSMTQDSHLNGVIATCPTLGAGENVPPIKVLLGKVMYSLFPKFTLNNGLDISGLSRDPEVAPKYNADPLVHHLVSARMGIDIINNGNFLMSHTHDLQWPSLLMQGTADRIVSVPLTKKFAQTAANEKLTFKEWNGFYHELHNEPEKDQVIDFMIGWMKNHLN